MLLWGKFPAHDSPWLLSPKGSPQWASPGSAKKHQDTVNPTLLDNLEAAVEKVGYYEKFQMERES